MFSLECANIRCRSRARVVLPLDEGPEIPTMVMGFLEPVVVSASASAMVILMFEAFAFLLFLVQWMFLS